MKVKKLYDLMENGTIMEVMSKDIPRIGNCVNVAFYDKGIDYLDDFIANKKIKSIKTDYFSGKIHIVVKVIGG